MKLLPVLSLLLCSCAGRVAYDTAGAGVGGLVASEVSHGNPLMTAAGAAGGVMASEAFQGVSQSAQKTQYNRGYDRGRSDAVKQQYWIMQNRQQLQGSKQRFYSLPAPESDGDIKLVPHKELLRVIE